MDEKDLLIQNLREESCKLKAENTRLKTRCKIITNGEQCFMCPIRCENRTAACGDAFKE